MSWLSYCYKTYQNSVSEIGKQQPGKVPLLPVAHPTQQVNIEVELDKDGNFQYAGLLAQDQRTTIIPCTEESSARTSGMVPHPLVDKLQYIAADYPTFGGSKESGWPLYHKQLQAWCTSPYAHPAVCTVLHYLEKECLIADLVKANILFIDENGTLPTKWQGNKEDKPPILDTLTGSDQTESFVRFRVDNVDLSRDTTVRESFIRFYETQLKDIDYCTVQGIKMPVSTLSPYKIRNPGDRAKLISSNDNTNYTYRGRFADAAQALSIGYETTQKAHSALRWLVSKQGVNTGDQTVLVWGTQNEAVPNVLGDTLDIAQEYNPLAGDDWDDFEEDTERLPADTQEEIARQFNRAILGYQHQLKDNSQTAVMILDSATPGRLSIRYYQELQGSKLLANIKDWHDTFQWQLEYRSVEEPTELGKKPKIKKVVFVGAPAPADIAKAAYGEKVDAKLKQATIERLIPCITNGERFPRDLMISAVDRATNSIGLDYWEQQKTQNIACALVRGYYHRNKKVDYPMNVDETIKDRNYLFGRILACAEQIERRALIQLGNESEKRLTNAERLRTAFALHPAATTLLLDKKLNPYLNRMKNRNGMDSQRYAMMQELLHKIGTENFTNKRLGELYLVGYADQMMDFKAENAEYKAKAKKQEE